MIYDRVMKIIKQIEKDEQLLNSMWDCDAVLTPREKVAKRTIEALWQEIDEVNRHVSGS